MLVPCQSSPNLQVLNLQGNNITEYGAEALAECLEYQTSLHEFSIRGNPIGDRAMVKLAKMLVS